MSGESGECFFDPSAACVDRRVEKEEISALVVGQVLVTDTGVYHLIKVLSEEGERLGAG